MLVKGIVQSGARAYSIILLPIYWAVYVWLLSVRNIRSGICKRLAGNYRTPQSFCSGARPPRPLIQGSEGCWHASLSAASLAAVQLIKALLKSLASSLQALHLLSTLFASISNHSCLTAQSGKLRLKHSSTMDLSTSSLVHCGTASTITARSGVGGWVVISCWVEAGCCCGFRRLRCHGNL